MNGITPEGPVNTALERLHTDTTRIDQIIEVRELAQHDMPAIRGLTL